MRMQRVQLLSLFLMSAVIGASFAADAGAPKDILTAGQKIHSQQNEELIIRHFFDDRRGGFYVDVGSYLPLQGSTTAYLELDLGWTGFALDAQDWLAASYAVKRPGAKFFNYIVTDYSGGTMSLFLAGPVSSTSKQHVDQFFKDDQKAGRKVTVETITLNDLLEREGVEKIDFMSMDIERHEPQALAGFDIEKYRPELLCIEAGQTTRARLLAYFGKHGYERIDEYLEYDSLNWYFRPVPQTGIESSPSAQPAE